MKKIFLFIVIIISIISVFFAYRILIESNVNSEKQSYSIYLRPNTKLDALIDSLKVKKVLKNYNSFKLLASRKKTFNPKAGHYRVKMGMSNRRILNMFAAGLQTPVKVWFNNARTKEEFAKKIANQLMFSSQDLLAFLNSNDSLKKFGFSPQTVKTMFIPNSYDFYWNVSIRGFCNKMYAYHQRFWNKNRLKKAKEIHLSPLEISTLASIVQAEQDRHKDEQPIIAGLYLNRLRKGIPLQADPTVIFALHDFTRRRLLKSDLKIKSPYNTYINKGLPPAPINFPSEKALLAVLNYDKNNYIFMCAKDDFSGYHYFSKTFRQHNLYARRYQKALSKSGIKK